MVKNMCLTAVSCLALMQCAGTAMKVMPEYATMKVQDSRLGIILINQDLSIANTDDVVDDLGGGAAKTVFSGFFGTQMTSFAKKDSKFGTVSFIDNGDTSGLISSTQNLSADDPIYLRIPPTKIFRGDSVPYLLIFDNFDISREQKPGTTGFGANGAMATTAGSDKLILTGTFVLWDNLAGKIVSFGKINEKQGVFMAMTKNTWIGILRKLSSKVFIGKPYGKAASQDESAAQ